MKESQVKELLNQCNEVSRTLRSLSHPVRLKILCQLMEDEKSVNELTRFCKIPQSAMSQFLNRMKNEGMLDSRKEGTYVYYALRDPRMIKLLKSIRDLYCC